MKPGWKTSEFWVALLPAISAVALAIHEAIKAASPYLHDPISWQTVVLVLGAVAGAWGYGSQRSAQKQVEQKLDPRR